MCREAAFELNHLYTGKINANHPPPQYEQQKNKMKKLIHMEIQSTITQAYQ